MLNVVFFVPVAVMRSDVCLPHFIHSAVDGCLPCLQFRATLHSVAMNMFEHVPGGISALIYMPLCRYRDRTAQSQAGDRLSFSRYCKCCANLCFHK